MFTGYKEITVKCLEVSWDIFGDGRTSSLVFGIFDSLRKSSVALGNSLKYSGIVVKWPKTP